MDQLLQRWEQVQHQHYQQTKRKKTDTHRWVTLIISAMWQGLLLMWEDRNDDQHGRDNIEQFGKEREKLLQKIDQLYTQKESIIIIRFCIYPAVLRFVLALDSSNVSINSQLPPYGRPEIFASLLTPHLGLAEVAFSCTCAWFLVPLRCAAR
jgi:hypothetical protein